LVLENVLQIVVHALGFSLTDTIRRHAERRFRSALTCYDEHILRVVVRLSDRSGERRGEEKCCHVQVRLAGLGDVVVEDFEADLYVAMARAAHRAGRTIKRRLSRRRDNARACGLHDASSYVETTYSARTNHEE
jgi:ribosome-associated translation inhibitor RaiA